MRKITVLILSCACLFSFGQDSLRVDSAIIKALQKQPISSFYSTQNLSIETAQTPFLYYKVYEWLGTRYKYAGTTLKGIDCSGFVGRMYRDVYCTEIGGGSKNFWAQVKPVEKEDLKEGDILFFKIKKGQISHVGIYLANNKFAHASTRNGVIISDLDEEYYKKHFYKGGRLGKERFKS